MRQALFVATANATLKLNEASDWAFGLICLVPLNLGLLSRGLISLVGRSIMILLDKEQYDIHQATYADQTGELQKQQIELQLLSAVSMVRDNYLETGHWTDEHTNAIRSLSNQLRQECDWDEESVHQYMRSVVEAGTGLHYGLDE